MQTQNRNLSSARDRALAALGHNNISGDRLIPVGMFHALLQQPVAHMVNEFRDLRNARDAAFAARQWDRFERLDAELIKIPQEIVMKDSYLNLVVTTGRNDALDKWLSGSAYTAAWYIGLISSVGWSQVVAGDTMASHAGWTEFAGYSNAARPTTAWSAAAAGAKSLSAGLVFNINAAGTVKGSFLANNSTKSGTTGILGSAGTFTGGDQPVVDTNTLTVNYSLSLTSS